MVVDEEDGDDNVEDNTRQRRSRRTSALPATKARSLAEDDSSGTDDSDFFERMAEELEAEAQTVKDRAIKVFFLN